MASTDLAYFVSQCACHDATTPYQFGIQFHQCKTQRTVCIEAKLQWGAGRQRDGWPIGKQREVVHECRLQLEFGDRLRRLRV